MSKRCKDCLHCTYDGLCLIARKWTLIDVEHDCRAFVRRAVRR